MSAFCPECMSDHHFVCSRPCNCRCTIDRLIEHTTHDNIIANTADVRHAPHAYTEYEIRQSNRELRDHLVDRRKYDDETLGVTPWHYRLRKALGKAFTASAVIDTARDVKDVL
jgi:hypothetical protein